MASIGNRTTAKKLNRGAARQTDVRKRLLAKVAVAAPESSAPKFKAARLKKSVQITEDEADVLISLRREKERRVSLAEVLQKHGYGLES